MAPTKLGIQVTQDSCGLYSHWVDVSNALHIDSMVLQDFLYFIGFCQNSNCTKKEHFAILIIITAVCSDPTHHSLFLTPSYLQM